MKPSYWIAVLAVSGAVIGYAIFRSTGWLGAGIGIVVGVLVGALIANSQSRGRK